MNVLHSFFPYEIVILTQMCVPSKTTRLSQIKVTCWNIKILNKSKNLLQL